MNFLLFFFQVGFHIEVHLNVPQNYIFLCTCISPACYNVTYNKAISRSHVLTCLLASVEVRMYLPLPICRGGIIGLLPLGVLI